MQTNAPARAFLRNQARNLLRRSEQLARKRPALAAKLLERAERLTDAALGGDDRCLVGLARLGAEVQS